MKVGVVSSHLKEGLAWATDKWFWLFSNCTTKELHKNKGVLNLK